MYLFTWFYRTQMKLVILLAIREQGEWLATRQKYFLYKLVPIYWCTFCILNHVNALILKKTKKNKINMEKRSTKLIKTILKIKGRWDLHSLRYLDCVRLDQKTNRERSPNRQIHSQYEYIHMFCLYVSDLYKQINIKIHTG